MLGSAVEEQWRSRTFCFPLLWRAAAGEDIGNALSLSIIIHCDASEQDRRVESSAFIK